MPESKVELLRLAGLAHSAGQLAEAERLVMEAIRIDPQDGQANLLMGVLAAKTDRHALAGEHLNRVLEANPESFEALFWLSILMRRTKQLSEATEYAKRAAKLRPGDAFGQNNLGLCYLEAARLEEAAAAFQRAAAIRPDMPQTLHNLGLALYKLGRDEEAMKAFDRALLIAPKSIDSFLGLGQALLSQTSPGEAAKCARRALALNPNSAEAHLLLASALVEDNRTGEAEGHLQKAIELNPKDAQAQGLLGQRFQSLGKFQEANRHLRMSLDLDPRQGFSYFAYLHNNKVTEADRPMLETMEGLIGEGGLDPRQTNFLHYGLGRAYEGLGEYEQAMRHFDSANRGARKLKFGNEVFDRKEYARQTDWLIQTFTNEFIKAKAGRGNPSDVPVLIVGMMRSGTTLAEQILSSHPSVGAAGEQRFWPATFSKMFENRGRSFTPELLPKLASQYLETLRRIAPGAFRITDKNPGNYEFLAPLHVAFPNARIIHMRRNPADTCISIYATPNRIPVDFAHDKENIAFAYEEYLRLMAHWRTVLPSDRFLEVNYEDVVADREREARRILDHIGLPWDDAVMHHETNVRNVVTPSLWQVRQPIYTSSLERWRRYEPWLGPFRRLLN